MPRGAFEVGFGTRFEQEIFDSTVRRGGTQESSTIEDVGLDFELPGSARTGEGADHCDAPLTVVSERVELGHPAREVLVPDTRIPGWPSVDLEQPRIGEAPGEDRVSDDLTPRLTSIPRPLPLDIRKLDRSSPDLRLC